MPSGPAPGGLRTGHSELWRCRVALHLAESGQDTLSCGGAEWSCTWRTQDRTHCAVEVPIGPAPGGLRTGHTELWRCRVALHLSESGHDTLSCGGAEWPCTWRTQDRTHLAVEVPSGPAPGGLRTGHTELWSCRVVLHLADSEQGTLSCGGAEWPCTWRAQNRAQ